MTTEQAATLVLKDGTGSYYLVSQETLELGRIPDEHKTAFEQAIATAQCGADGDTQGFMMVPVVRVISKYFWQNHGLLQQVLRLATSTDT